MYIRSVMCNYVVFCHIIGKETIYVGYDRYEKALDLTKMKRCPDWIKFIEGNFYRVRIEILSEWVTEEEARESHKREVEILNPRIRLLHKTKFRRVICLSDGKTFSTSISACYYYGIPKQTMSSHLNGRDGYASIKGLKFMREVR